MRYCQIQKYEMNDITKMDQLNPIDNDFFDIIINVRVCLLRKLRYTVVETGTMHPNAILNITIQVEQSQLHCPLFTFVLLLLSTQTSGVCIFTGFLFNSLVKKHNGLSWNRPFLQLNSLYIGFSLRVLKGLVFLQNMSACLGSRDAF